MNQDLEMLDNLPADAVEVGRVIEAWGVKGGLKLQAFSNTADGLLRVKQWYLQSPTGQVKVWSVDHAKWHSDTVLAQLMGMTDRDVAQTYKAWRVWVSKSALPKTQEGEYYWMDLIGCTVLASNELSLGTIVDVTDTGVHAVIHVDCGSQYETTLIPFVAAYIDTVDLVQKTVRTQWQLDWLDLKTAVNPKQE